MIRLNKRGQESFELIVFVVRIIFLVIVLFSFRFLIGRYVVDTLNVQQTQAEVFADKLFYSPNGIVYFDDELKQTIPGIIDIKKVTNDNLNLLANYSDDSFISAKVDVLDMNENIITTAVYNNKTYYRWLPIVKRGTEGAGGVQEINKTMLIQYVKDDRKQQGFLHVVVLQPGK